MVGILPDGMAVIQATTVQQGTKPIEQEVDQDKEEAFDRVAQRILQTMGMCSDVAAFKPLLNLKLFIAQCAPNQEVVIYGLKACRYMEIKNWLEHGSKAKCFKNAFSYLDGTGKICVKNNKIKSLFKSALVDFILNNVESQRHNMPIVPVVFIVELDYLKLNIRLIVEKRLAPTSYSNSYVTNAEIRTAYRLCYDPFLGEEICQVALRSFLFIALKTNPKSACEQYAFSILPKPWESSDYQEGWKKRIKPQPSTWQIQLKRVLEISEEQKNKETDD